jgi:uncharacterized protein (DUF433 family)
MDWTGCELVEVIPGKVSGKPLVVGTRIPADLVVDLVDSGYKMKEILEDYPSLTPEIVQDIATFAHARQEQHTF